MARLIQLILVSALVAALVAAASWGLALHRVDVLLGDPPPQMGAQTTTFLWDRKEWSFAFGPTRIPGASSVRIYVSPIGQVIRTEPADLDARVKAFHNTGT